MYYTPQYGESGGFTAPSEPYLPAGPPMMPEPYTMGDDKLAKDIKEAVIKEAHAYDYYTKLASMARDEQDRKTLLTIRHDEMKHYRWFTAILQRLGAEQPSISQGTLPRNFEEGVRHAVRDELDAAAFYQNIAYRARDRSIEMHFLHAAQDEQRHAAWLQYMLSAPQPSPHR